MTDYGDGPRVNQKDQRDNDMRLWERRVVSLRYVRSTRSRVKNLN